METRRCHIIPSRDHAALIEKIEIATEGEDCDECVRKLRGCLMKISGVQNVDVDLARERVIVTFDARKTHAPDLHDAILKSGYKPAPFADDLAPSRRQSQIAAGDRPLQRGGLLLRETVKRAQAPD